MPIKQLYTAATDNVSKIRSLQSRNAEIRRNILDIKAKQSHGMTSEKEKKLNKELVENIKKINDLKKGSVKARLAECADLESSKPEWTEMALRVLKHFVNTSKAVLVMAMNDGLDNDDVLNMGDEDDVLEKVQFAMWRIPSKVPFKLLSGRSSAGSMANLALLNKFLTSNGLDLVVESVSGQMYISLSTDPRLFSPSAVL